MLWIALAVAMFSCFAQRLAACPAITGTGDGVNIGFRASDTSDILPCFRGLAKVSRPTAEKGVALAIHRDEKIADFVGIVAIKYMLQLSGVLLTDRDWATCAEVVNNAVLSRPPPRLPPPAPLLAPRTPAPALPAPAEEAAEEETPPEEAAEAEEAPAEATEGDRPNRGRTLEAVQKELTREKRAHKKKRRKSRSCNACLERSGICAPR